MLKSAVRLCDAEFGNIYRWDGEALHLVATQNAPPAFAEARRLSAFPPNPKTPTGRMIANKKVVHIADLRAEKAYATRSSSSIAFCKAAIASIRSAMAASSLRQTRNRSAITSRMFRRWVPRSRANTPDSASASWRREDLPLRPPQLAASLFSSAYNEEQRPSADVRLICGAADRPHAARLCSAIRPKGRGLRFDPGYHAKAAAAQRYARQEAASGIGQRLAPVPG